MKRDVEESTDLKGGNWDGGEEEPESNEKRKHRSGRSSKDKSESRKRSGGLSRGESDEDDYEAKKEQRSKQMKKKQEESSLEQLSSWYQDGDQESRLDGGDRSERRRSNSKVIDKSKEEKSLDGESDKYHDRESKSSDRRESGRDRTHGSSDLSRRRRWDEADPVRKGQENENERGDLKSSKLSESRHEGAGEKTSSKSEYSDNRARGLDSKSDKSLKSSNKEEKSKTRGRSESSKDDDRASPLKKTSGRDASETASEAGRSNRSRTPERSGKRHQESEQSEAEYEKSDNKWGEQEKDGRRDERSRGRDYGWSDRDRDREGSKDNWKRKHSSNDKDSKDGDLLYDRSRERDFPRQGRERSDSERPHGRSGGRKDGNRGEAVKTLSSGGVSNENYDVIEIQTKSNDYGRGGSGPNFARRSEMGQQPDKKPAGNDEEWAYNHEDRQKSENFSSGPYGEDSRDEVDESDYSSGKGRNLRGATHARSNSGQTSNRGSLPPPGMKGNRLSRVGKGRPGGRETQQGGIPLPLMGPPFGNLGMPPPGSIQSLAPAMSPIPGPPIAAGVFMPPFAPPLVWPGPRGVDANMLPVPPVLSPLPPGPSGPRFPPTFGTPNPNMYFNPPGSERGGPPILSGPTFDVPIQMGRGTTSDKSSGGWVPPPRSGGPPGKAPSRGEQNDYSQNFVDTGMRPQNFIRELELTNVEDYPKLRELIQKKDEIVTKSASAPMYLKCDLHELELSPELFGTKFDVILVDPPWEEYVHRAPGVADNMEYWTFEEIINLKIEAIADTPSFIFLWVGDGVGLEQGRQCLKKWGFRRCEDICWVKTNKSNAAPTLRHDSRTLFQRSKEHCLMGIKGTVRRSTDGHIIHANIDTDVIIAEEPPYGSTQKPEDMYRIVEHFALGRRRLELFGEDHNIRAGWVTVGKGLSSSNFDAQAYTKNFIDKDGKVWQGGGGRNPPPEAPHLVVTTPDIEALRPKSPMKNQQQQQSNPVSANSSNRRTTGNSPQQNPNIVVINQEASGSNFSVHPPPWVVAAGGPSAVDGFRGGPDSSNGSVRPDDKVFDMYGFNRPGNGEFLEFDPQRQMNIL
ncbi:PREDICTED: methyltransferase-like protein 1 [Tarenaya hassleriana]|uniref:methyltransferase-like protein 1 n=1 Tax=Tarenaya hassleriana TaxID=28532 RepID=UPI00053C2A54|nr:PREDICTED: methyltransferase-like protein 1 [Tarenaya hassleriana]